MSGRSYLKTLAMSEIRLIFPFFKKLEQRKKDGFLKYILLILISPLILYRAFFQNTIPYVELVVTPKCNLKCVGCANLMPCYDRTVGHIEFDILKGSIDALTSVSKRIEVIKLIGGEPFLYPRLSEIVACAEKNKHVKKIIITTNGSITPKEEQLLKLKSKKLTIDISDYKIIDKKNLTELLNKNGINYEIIEFESWTDYGDTKNRKFSDEILSRSFRECASAECKTILDGKLYICPRAAHGNALGIIPAKNDEYISMLEKPSIKDIKKLYSIPYIKACNHCTPVWERLEIECGAQPFTS